MKPAGMPGRFSVGRDTIWGLIILLVAVALAGCLGQSDPGQSPDEGAGPVERHSSDDLRGGRGGVRGHVLTDAGEPVANATVTAGNDSATTNATGGFFVRDVPPGNYQVRVEHPRYETATRQVEVTAGTVVVFEIALTGADWSALWNGAQEITLLDRWVRYQQGGRADVLPVPPYDPGNFALNAILPDCVDDGSVDSGLPNVTMEDGLILPGTARIAVTLTWNTTDYHGDDLVVAYKPGGSDGWIESPYIPNGQTHYLNVSATSWDNPEAEQTDWTFYLCTTRDDDERPLLVNLLRGEYRPGTVIGEIHMTMKIRREG